MKLPIKKEYFDQIKSGKKTIEYRDAHITFVCEETGETLRKEVTKVGMSNKIQDKHHDVLEDRTTIVFYLKN